MGKVFLRLNENKLLFAVTKIMLILTVSTLLFRVVLPADFLRIDTTHFFEKYVNYETLSLSQWLILFWNDNVHALVANLFVIFIVILLIFRFRFTKAENFQLSRYTVVIVLSCLVFSVFGYLYMTFYQFSHYGFSWQISITDFLKQILVIALLEELIYRGFIANILFRLKPSGLKILAAVAISAAIFGFIHIDASIVHFLRYGFTPPIRNIVEPFFFTAGCGVSWAIVLYYKKDLISIIFIHAANNILSNSYAYSGRPLLIGVLYVVFFIIFIICYPVFLIFKAKKQQQIFG